jgi:hypothetical protein
MILSQLRSDETLCGGDVAMSYQAQRTLILYLCLHEHKPTRTWKVSEALDATSHGQSETTFMARIGWQNNSQRLF